MTMFLSCSNVTKCVTVTLPGNEATYVPCFIRNSILPNGTRACRQNPGSSCLAVCVLPVLHSREPEKLHHHANTTQTPTIFRVSSRRAVPFSILRVTLSAWTFIYFPF